MNMWVGFSSCICKFCFDFLLGLLVVVGGSFGEVDFKLVRLLGRDILTFGVRWRREKEKR